MDFRATAFSSKFKNKHKLFKPHYLSDDPETIKQYKRYNNKLNKVKSAAKKCYFASQFSLNKNNMKMTWKLIGMIVNRYKKKAPLFQKFSMMGNVLQREKRYVIN